MPELAAPKKHAQPRRPQPMTWQPFSFLSLCETNHGGRKGRGGHAAVGAPGHDTTHIHAHPRTFTRLHLCHVAPGCMSSTCFAISAPRCSMREEGGTIARHLTHATPGKPPTRQAEWTRHGRPHRQSVNSSVEQQSAPLPSTLRSLLAARAGHPYSLVAFRALVARRKTRRIPPCQRCC